MADITFFDGFTMTWSQDGVQASISQDAFKTGWAFIGDTPPAREQFNTVHYQDGLRQQWLYGQIKGVTDAAGLTLTATDTSTLWTAISNKLDTKANGSITITAGVGLTGGGELSSSPTISMGTPSDISSTTTNSASGTTHTHTLAETGVNAGEYGSKSQIPTFAVDAKGRVTKAGTNKVSVGDVQDVLAIENGGTGSTTAAAARAALGLASFIFAESATLSENGCITLKTNDGTKSLLLQWGKGTLAKGAKTATVDVTFATPFGELWHVSPIPTVDQVTAGGFNVVMCYLNPTTTKCTIQGDVNQGNDDYVLDIDVPFTYFAIGKAP